MLLISFLSRMVSPPICVTKDFDSIVRAHVHLHKQYDPI